MANEEPQRPALCPDAGGGIVMPRVRRCHDSTFKTIGASADNYNLTDVTDKTVGGVGVHGLEPR